MLSAVNKVARRKFSKHSQQRSATVWCMDSHLKGFKSQLKQWWVPFFVTCRAQLWMSAVIPRCTIFSGGSGDSVPFLVILLPSPLALRWMNYWLFSILHIHLTRNIYVYTCQIGVHITLSTYASNSVVLYSYGLQWHINDKCQITIVNAGPITLIYNKLSKTLHHMLKCACVIVSSCLWVNFLTYALWLLYAGFILITHW